MRKNNNNNNCYYYLTAIGLTPGGSGIDLHKTSTQNIEDGTHITITRGKNIYKGKKSQVQDKNWEVRAVSRICELYPGMCLTTEEKARKKTQFG
jgi:archaellin